MRPLVCLVMKKNGDNTTWPGRDNLPALVTVPGRMASQYSQQDIFQGIFANEEMFAELNRMFAQAGLRFDRDFLNRVYFGGRGFVFQFYTTPQGAYTNYQNSTPAPITVYKPNWFERQLLKIGRFAMRKLFGLQFEPPVQSLDQHIDFEISQDEATKGGEKQVAYKQGKKTKKLMVKIPSGIKSGTKIRLKGMGMTEGNKSGDLYLHVKAKE